jgi:eukaryotic-like serine/threonine-protein kinase
LSLAPGTRVGAYEIQALLGAGGMGEVYRARDPKLDRDVALKVLPPAVAQDPDRLTRFEREAKSLAALNHPNIAQIYAVEDAPEGAAIVMELVPGVPLHGPLPLETALDYAKQIASALEAAHERGIIHRDLKPGNVMVTPEGVVKVLDFGLAGRSASDSSISQDLSPTLTVRATQAGVIIGTAAYMSPEQAAGKAADKRADIWSFGVILWELLAGAWLFDGETISHTLADVLRAPIDFTKLPPATPSSIRHLLERCLDRDVKTRLRDIGEARVTIEKYFASPKAIAADGVSTPSQTTVRRSALAWSVAAVATVAAALLAFVHLRDKPSPAEPVRYMVLPPERTSIVDSIVLSPDGRRFTFVAPGASGRPVLWVQSLDSLNPRSLPGTEDAAAAPFWSHDSRFIFFGATGFSGHLKRVDASGGPAQTIADYNGGFRGGDSSATNGILFSAGDGIWHMAGDGAQPKRVTKTDPVRRETQHGGPRFLSDGRSFVYFRASTIPEVMGLYIGSLDATPDAQSRTRLVIADAAPVFVPPSTDQSAYLLFLRQGTLLAQRVDERSQPIGNVLTMAEDVGSNVSGGWFSASATGVLSYRIGRGPIASELVWFDRSGKRLGQLGPPMEIQGGGVALSRDGKHVAVTRGDAQVTSALGLGSQPGAHVWVADVSRGVFSRLNTSPNESESSQVMTPDGRVVFTTTRNGIGDLYWMAGDGTGMPEPLIVKSPTVKHPNGVSPDARFLIFDDHTAQRQDLWILPLTPRPAGGERKPFPYLVTDADETFGQFSPDGKWIAYDSDESGVREVYVQGFAPDRVPSAAFGKWQISTAGGNKPKWSPDGKELYYIAPDRKLMAVPMKIGTTVEPGLPVPLFEVNSLSFFPYDVAPDGRFLVNTARENAVAATPPIVVLNWQSTIAK